MSLSEPTRACPDREAALADYVFGTLPEPERHQLAEHVTTCAACRYALSEAQAGFNALDTLVSPPLPFFDYEASGADVPIGHPSRTAANRADVLPVVEQSLSTRRMREHSWYWQGAAAAALVLIGIGVGRWLPPAGAPTDVLPEPRRELGIGSEEIDARARAEVLLELGVPWVGDLTDLLTWVSDPTLARPRVQDLREQARRLIRDGQALRAALDPEQEPHLVATVNRAEVFLEEVAALDPVAGPAFFSDVELSAIRIEVTAADPVGAAARALVASGWPSPERDL